MADIRFVSKADAKAIVQAASAKYTNQNAIGKVKVGNTIFTAEEAVDQIELIEGTNVSIAVSGDQITISATDTTYNNVVADSTGAADSGLMTSADKYKLDGIAAGAEVNQNAFSNVAIGSSTLEADSKTDTLTITQGTNVTITPDTTNDAITIAAKDTTYTLEQDAVDGHIITFTPSTGSATTITIPDNNTTYNAAIASVNGTGGTDGLLEATDKEKLDGIAAGAQVNVLEGVQVAGTDLAITNKKVNITVGAGTSGVGTFKVNGVQYTVFGLGDAAGMDVAASVADGETGLVTGDQVNDAIAAQVSATYKPGGSLAPAGVASSLLVEANEGKVYNLSAELTLDATSAALFVDGTAGESFPEGTNIVVVDNSGTYKFDVLAGFVDLSAYAKTADFGGLTAEELAEVIAEL